MHGFVCFMPLHASLGVCHRSSEQALPGFASARLTRSAVLEQVMCHPTAAHGGFLLDGKFRQHMLHAIVRTLEAGAKAT